MEDKTYQLVYKSCYHGEIYSDPQAIRIPLFPDADIMEFIPVEGTKPDEPSTDDR